jgi:hypothetical protein
MVRRPLTRFTRTAALVVFGWAGWTGPAVAQSKAAVDLGGQVTMLSLGEFDETVVGAGAQASWEVTPRLTVDGLLSVFPGDGGNDGGAVGKSRKVLGLVGVRTGQTFGRLQLYARARPGFLNFAAQDSVACILIVPAPLSCRIAGGYTAFATEIGGGVRVALDANHRLQLNVDVGDLLVRYAPGGQFRRDANLGEIADSTVASNLIVNVGLGWRF